MFKLIILTIKLYKEYRYQRKCLASMADNNYRKSQRRIDEIYKEMHETLAVKLLSRKSFVYCQCGNDVYDGVSLDFVKVIFLTLVDFSPPDTK